MSRSNEVGDTPKKLLASQSAIMTTPATEETTYRYKLEKSFGQLEGRPHEWNRLGKDIDHLKYEVLLATERKLPVFDYDLPLIGNVFTRKPRVSSGDNTRSSGMKTILKSKTILKNPTLKKSLTKQKTNSLSKSKNLSITKTSEFRSTAKSNTKKLAGKFNTVRSPLDKEDSVNKGMVKAKTLKAGKGSVSKGKTKEGLKPKTLKHSVTSKDPKKSASIQESDIETNDNKKNRVEEREKINSKKDSIDSFKEELDKRSGNEDVVRELRAKKPRAAPQDQHNTSKDSIQSAHEKDSLKKSQTYNQSRENEYSKQEKKDLKIEELDKDYAPKAEAIPRTDYNKGHNGKEEYERQLHEGEVYDDTKGSTKDFTKNFSRSPLTDYKAQAPAYNNEFRTAPIDIYERGEPGRSYLGKEEYGRRDTSPVGYSREAAISGREYDRQPLEYNRRFNDFHGSELRRRTPRAGEYNFERTSDSYAPYQRKYPAGKYDQYPTAREYERLYDPYNQRKIETRDYYGARQPSYEIGSSSIGEYGKKYREELPRSEYEATSPDTYRREYSGMQPRGNYERGVTGVYEVRSESPRYLSQPMEYGRRDAGGSYGLRSGHGVLGVSEYGLRDDYRGDLLGAEESARPYEVSPRGEDEMNNLYRGRVPRPGDYEGRGRLGGDIGEYSSKVEGIKRNEYGRLASIEEDRINYPEGERRCEAGRSYPRNEEYDRPIRNKHLINELQVNKEPKSEVYERNELYELEYGRGRPYADRNKGVPDAIDEAEELFKDYDTAKPKREYERSRSLEKKNAEQIIEEEIKERRGRTPKKFSLRDSIKRLASPSARVTESNWLRKMPEFKELESKVGTEQALVLTKQYDAHCWKCFGKDLLLAPYDFKSKEG
jgi:hypothetical protein